MTGALESHFMVSVKEQICDCMNSVLLLLTNTMGQPVYGKAGKQQHEILNTRSSL
jgi:hypothetical protein